MNLADALRSLDEAVDDHWTASGLPRLDVLRDLTGSADLSRKMVDAEAPGVTRETYAATFGGNGDQQVVAAPVPDEPGAVAEPDKAPEPVSKESQLAVIAELREKIVTARVKKDDLDRDIDAMDRRLTVVETLYNAQFPPMNPSEAVKLYHKRQLEGRIQTAKQAEKMAMAMGLPPNSRMGTSKLDRAMAPKRMTGANRPPGHLIGDKG